MLRATTACTFSTSQLPKVVRAWCAFYILTWKCASRHNGVHSFDISTSKSGPNLVYFLHFDFEMCFAPQRRTLFPHLNFQKWSENGVFSTFDFELCFAPQRRAIFHLSSGQLVALASLLFDPPEHWKNTVFRDFPTFSRICIFFLLTLSLLLFSLLIFLFSLPLPCSAFHLSILSEVWLLNFLRLSSGCIRAVTQVSRHKNLHARNAVAKPSSLYHTFILSKTLGKHWQTQIDMFFRPGNATHWQEGATTSTHICTRACVKPIWRNMYIYIYMYVCV